MAPFGAANGISASLCLSLHYAPIPTVLRTPLPGALPVRIAKRIVVAVVGGTVTLIGIALIVLPGPAFIVIPIGLSILATEFLWANRWLQKLRQMATSFRSKTKRDATGDYRNR